jgi:ribosomal protein S12 methylthiotransferase
MERVSAITSIIEKKTKKRNKKFLGRKMEVLIDGVEEGEYYGRTKASAPDIDPIVWIFPGNKKLEIGEIYKTSITDLLGCDIGGEVLPN